MERVALYMRKSTEVQPWDNQKDVLDKYVADHADMQVVGEYCDVGSGSKVLPDMQKLLEDAEKDVFDTVLVASLDRLGRDPHLLTEVFRVFMKCGVSFADISSNFVDTRTVDGRKFANMLVCFTNWVRPEEEMGKEGEE